MIDLNEYTKEDILVILEERDALLEVLRKMTSAAQDIDGDEYFPSKPLDKAIGLLISLEEY